MQIAKAMVQKSPNFSNAMGYANICVVRGYSFEKVYKKGNKKSTM
jgi:hypothetical protein